MDELKWGFSKREKLGLLGIALVILILFFINNFLPSSFQHDPPVNTAAFQAALQESNTERKLIAQIKKEKQEAYQNKYKKKETGKSFNQKFKSSTQKKKNFVSKKSSSSSEEKILNQPKAELSFFNPNFASLENLITLGIPARTAQTIINFRNKGGKFLKPEDLKIVYGISEPIYQTLKDYIQIPEVISKSKIEEPKVERSVTIDINESTAEEWMQLRGIGPSLSNRIVNYREKLGGFTSFEQLKEVYNLPDTTFNTIQSAVILANQVKKRSINDPNISILTRHPYVTNDMAGKIITRRDRNETFTNWKEFEKYLKITPKQLENIQQYFTIP